MGKKRIPAEPRKVTHAPPHSRSGLVAVELEIEAHSAHAVGEAGKLQRMRAWVRVERSSTIGIFVILSLAYEARTSVEASAVATMTVSLPDAMKEWIEAEIRRGDYASASDYVRDLIRRDRDRREQEFTSEDLRQKLAASRDSGVSSRTVDEIFAEAQEIAKARRLVHE
jgi:antitoxin ParD1/3/4